jgi:rubrerythrin
MKYSVRSGDSWVQNKFIAKYEHGKGGKMVSTTAGEILQFAVRMEGCGERFYRDVASTSSVSKVNELFIRLASEEAEHKRIFESLLLKMDAFMSPESYPPEYLEYFYNYVDSKVIFKDENKMFWSETFDVLKALDFAIQMEFDSVVFYQEMKVFVPVEDNKKIESIIDEERRHFAQLSKVRKDLA